jgi:Zn-dependent peptidase ImmA (M78 family)
MSLPNFTQAKQKAAKILEDFGYKDLCVDPVAICDSLGVLVKFGDFGENKAKISGFFYQKENCIYVNSNETPRRQTFTIAHELGHYIMHKEYIESKDYKVVFRDSETVNDKSDIEKEADCFAAHLLVPKFMLDKYYKRLNLTIQELSDLFLVSQSVIVNRIKTEYGK